MADDANGRPSSGDDHDHMKRYGIPNSQAVDQLPAMDMMGLETSPSSPLPHHRPQQPVHGHVSTPPRGRRGPWSEAEDNALLASFSGSGQKDWSVAAMAVGSRSAKQCRERYHQNLKSDLNHDPITPEEGNHILAMVEKHGKKWADIARSMNGRCDNAVKNWWNGNQNRRKRKEREQARAASASLSPRRTHAAGGYQAPYGSPTGRPASLGYGYGSYNGSHHTGPYDYPHNRPSSQAGPSAYSSQHAPQHRHDLQGHHHEAHYRPRQGPPYEPHHGAQLYERPSARHYEYSRSFVGPHGNEASHAPEANRGQTSPTKRHSGTPVPNHGPVTEYGPCQASHHGSRGAESLPSPASSEATDRGFSRYSVSPGNYDAPQPTTSVVNAVPHPQTHGLSVRQYELPRGDDGRHLPIRSPEPMSTPRNLPESSMVAVLSRRPESAVRSEGRCEEQLHVLTPPTSTEGARQGNSLGEGKGRDPRLDVRNLLG